VSSQNDDVTQQQDKARLRHRRTSKVPTPQGGLQVYSSCGGADEDGHLNHANDVKQRSTIQFMLETAAGAELVAAASGDAPKLTSMAPAHSHNSTPRVHALPHAEVNKLTKRFQGCTAAEQTVDKSGVAYATITIVKPNVRQTHVFDCTAASSIDALVRLGPAYS